MLGTVMKNQVRYPSGSQMRWGSGQTLVLTESLEYRPWEMGKPVTEEEGTGGLELSPGPLWTPDLGLKTIPLL